MSCLLLLCAVHERPSQCDVPERYSTAAALAAKIEPPAPRTSIALTGDRRVESGLNCWRLDDHRRRAKCRGRGGSRSTASPTVLRTESTAPAAVSRRGGFGRSRLARRVRFGRCSGLLRFSAHFAAQAGFGAFIFRQIYSAAAWASWLTTDSAIRVSASSVAFSSLRVASSNVTAFLSPNSSAQVRSVPYRDIS
jgi:hypothetical protein